MKDNLYRDRLEKPLNEKVLEFLSSLKDDLWIAEEDIIGTEVHNIMLYEQGIIDKNEIKLIITSLEKLKEKVLSNQLELDDKFEDIHPFFENKVIDDIGIEIGGKIHTGRSRNDQVSVDIRMKIRKQLNRLTKYLMNLVDILINISENSINIFMPLYTHLQKGQLGVFSHYINNYIYQIIRSLERIEEIYNRINKNPLGACAIGGTNIEINRQRTAELLGFNGIVENSIDAISSRDYIYETITCLSLISIQFSRIAEDLLIWSTAEFNFVELDDQFCSVSSVMPQKRNPDSLELIRSKTSKIISNSFAASLIIKAIPTGYFRDFQDLKPLIRQSFKSLFSVIEMISGVFSTIKINKEKLVSIINESYILALDLAEILVQDLQIPFRQAHKIVACLVKDSKTPKDLFNIKKLEKIIHDMMNKKIELPTNLIDSLENLELCLKKRRSEGSPSRLEVEKLLKDIKEKKISLNNQYLKRIEKLTKANTLREELIDKIRS